MTTETRQPTSIIADTAAQKALSRHMARVDKVSHAIARTELPTFASPVEEFFATKLTAVDRERIGGITATMDSSGAMAPECRAVVYIPARYSERGLGDTLDFYAQQTGKTPFEVIVLVNGPKGADLDSSTAYTDARRVQAAHPELQLSIGRVHYDAPDGQVKIGRVRKDLAAIAIQRAYKSNVDLDNLILLSRDADPQSVSHQSVERVIQSFDLSNSSPDGQLAALGGFVDYTDSSFASNHFLFAYKRFLDLLEIVDRHSDDTSYFQTLNDQNAAFRASDYMESGGYPNARVAESNRIVQRLVESGKRVGYRRGRDHTVVTSDRRIVASLNQRRFDDQYQSFGKPDDSGIYRNLQTLDDPEQYQISSPNFQSLVEQTFRDIYTDKASRTPHTQAVVQERAARAAQIMGIQIAFEDDDLKVVNLDRFRAYVQEKFPLAS